MDKEETLKLVFDGRHAWNDWAEEKLAEKTSLESSGGSLAIWREEAGADFSGFRHRQLDCSGFLFPADANFVGASLQAGSSFAGARFFGAANFTNVVFFEGALFGGARFHEGVKFVNAHVRQRPAEFAQIEVNGDASFEAAKFETHTDFEQAKFLGSVDFSRAEFLQTARFDNGTFSDDAVFLATRFSRNASWFDARFARSATFSDAVFLGSTRFDAAEFAGPAVFIEAEFLNNASFRKAKFLAEANFTGTTFQETFRQLANFADTEFRKKVDFQRARFRGLARFRSSHFYKAASFTAISVESSFDISEAHFHNDVPSFIQAHFPEAPRLDQIRVPSVPELRRAQIELGPYVTAKYRALKRLALQGHDHERELQFFTGELQSLRVHADRPWPNFKNVFQRTKDGTREKVWPGGARYWFGLSYEVCSNFGRSITRPLVLLGLVTLLFAELYYGRHFLQNTSSTCLDGKGSAVHASAYLAVRKGLIFPGLSQDQKLDQAYACLYGMTTLMGDADGDIAIIPDSVAYLSILQTSISAVLIFLFLLAVRNHFRIK